MTNTYVRIEGKGLLRGTVTCNNTQNNRILLLHIVAGRFVWHSSSCVRTLNVSSEGRHLSYVKSLDTASIKFGADMRMVKVQMIEKSEKATRHNLSTTAAANFHSLQIASPSSCSRKRLAMYCTSSRIWAISGTCSSSKVCRVCSELTLFGEVSVLGGKAGLSVPIEW